MKIKTLFLLAALAASGLLHAESVEIPVLYRNPAAEVKTGQLQAFGFYENDTLIVLAFQIKDLETVVKNPKAVMSFYSDSDNDLKTGRFPNARGWDFQINMNLHRKTAGMAKWNGNEAHGLGKCRMSIKADMLYLTFLKSAAPGIEFKEQFKIRTLQLNENRTVNKQKPVGVFPSKFELPATK